MVQMIGRNVNKNDTATVTTVTLNSATATTISSSNLSRTAFSVCLAPGTSTVDVYIRLYPAATDNVKHGEILTRDASGNSSLFRPSWFMIPDNIYPGEISAITDSGTVDVYVTEY